MNTTDTANSSSVRELAGAGRVLAALVEAARPGMWLKPLFLMLVASTYALKNWPDLGRLALGFVVVGPLAWGGLYIANALTDIRDDSLHPVKRLRPFPSGRVSVRIGIAVAIGAIGLACLMSLLFGIQFAACVWIMTLKQFAYTLPPLRLKKRFGWDILSGSLGNSTLRFAAGWFLVTSAWSMPLLLLVFAECVQLAGFLVNRLFTNYSAGLEARLAYESTTTHMSPQVLQRVIAGCWGVGLTSLLLVIVNSRLGWVPEVLGALPLQSLIVLALLVGVLPLFSRAMGRADRFSYRESQLYYDLPLLYIFLLSILLSLIISLYSGTPV